MTRTVAAIALMLSATLSLDAAAQRAPLQSDAAVIRCASDDFRYTLCEGNTRGGVHLVRQLSRTECVEDRTWGFDRRGVWVDKGCVGEFALATAGSGAVGTSRLSGDGIDGDSSAASGETVTCESRDFRRRYCAAELRGRSVTVLRNISRERCEEGSNFGVDERGLWVDNGCRAEFRIVDRVDR
jgi:hypothetical protein